MNSESWEYISLDDDAQLKIARADPIGFIRNLPAKKIALDEVQRLPELFVSIKQVVDEEANARTLSYDWFRQCPVVAEALRFPGRSDGGGTPENPFRM